MPLFILSASYFVKKVLFEKTHILEERKENRRMKMKRKRLLFN